MKGKLGKRYSDGVALSVGELLLCTALAILLFGERTACYLLTASIFLFFWSFPIVFIDAFITEILDCYGFNTREA